MLKIAICDDEAVYRENTEKYCKEYFQKKGKFLPEEVAFFTFSSGEELLSTNEAYDILLLDIEMPDSDGIHVKEYYEKNRKETRIIFLTSHVERAFEAFGKNVLCFLKKPIEREEFQGALEKAMSDLQGAVLEIEENGTVVMIPVKQIRYIEAQDKYTIVFTETREYMFRKTIKFWEEQLPEPDFCRIHKSFLVGFDFFLKEKDEVVLEEDKRIKISRKNKEEVMNKYKEYLRRKMKGM